MCGSALQSIIFPAFAAAVIGLSCYLLGFWQGRTEAWRKAAELARGRS